MQDKVLQGVWLVWAQRGAQRRKQREKKYIKERTLLREKVKNAGTLLFPRVMSMSPVNGKAGAVSTIRVVCLALQAKVIDQVVEQLNKIEVSATTIRIGEEAKKNS